MKLVFALLGVAAVAAAILFEGGSLWDFLHPTSGLLVVGATVGLSLAHHSAAKLSAAFKAALGREPLDNDVATGHAAVLSTTRMVALASGAVGFIVGLVHVFKNLSDPNNVGAGVAIMLTSVLYALILSELFIGPLINRICARVHDKPSPPLEPSTPSAMILLLCTLGGLCTLALVLFIVGNLDPL